MASTQAPTRPSWDIASVASSSVDSRTTLEKPSMVHSFLPNERALYWPKNTSALLPLTRFPGSAVPGVAASIRADTLRSPVPTASSPDAVGTDRPPASRVPPRPPLRSPSHPLVVPSLRCFLPHGRYTPAHQHAPRANTYCYRQKCRGL